MIQLLLPVAAASFDWPAVSSAWQSAHLARAGLIDLDATIITQALFFFTLLFALPSLVYKPMLERFGEREARTEGARNDAKALKRQARDEISRYDTAVANQRKDALAERAETRAQAQKQADAMVATARAEAAQRVAAGIAEQRAQAESAKSALAGEARTLAAAIAGKLQRGSN